MVFTLVKDGLTHSFDDSKTYYDSQDREFEIREINSDDTLSICYKDDKSINNIDVEMIKNVGEYIIDNDTIEINEENNKKEFIPFIFHQGKKVYFNRPIQKIKESGLNVTVIKYFKEGKVIARDNEGNENTYDPLEDFENFKTFADITVSKMKRKNGKFPSVSFMHGDSKIDAIIYPNRRFASVMIDGEEVKGQVVGDSDNKFIFKKKDDRSTISVDFDQLSSYEEIKSKAIFNYKKENGSRNTVDYENKNPLLKSSMINEKSYKQAASSNISSSTSSSSSKENTSSKLGLNANDLLESELKELESKKSRLEKLEKELLLEENKLLKKYLSPK